jgi:subtilisin family serine protease
LSFSTLIMIWIPIVSYSQQEKDEMNQRQSEISSLRFPTVETDDLLKENQWLIFFNNRVDMNTFLSEYSVITKLNNLMGVIISTSIEGVSNLEKQFSFLTMESFYPLTQSKFRINIEDYDIVNNIDSISVSSLSSAKSLGLNEMRELNYYGAGTKVGIMDDGIFEHIDFEDRIKGKIGLMNTAYGFNLNKTPSPGNHGTPVAGLVGGAGIGNGNALGMAPETWLYDIDSGQISGSEFECTMLAMVMAIEWALEHEIDIINESFGLTDDNMIKWSIDLNTPYNLWQETIKRATNEGILFVKSAGNNPGEFTINMDDSIHVLCVGATEESFTQKATFSSMGPMWGTNAIKPDVIAPGVNVLTTNDNGAYTEFSGTSAAAPHISGAAAVLLGALRESNLDVNPGTLKSSIMATATELRLDTYMQGAGRPNITAAFDYILNAKRIVNHPITSCILAVDEPMKPFNLLQGSIDTFHLSLISSENQNLSVSVSGNASDFITFPQLTDGELEDQFSHDLIVKMKIPDNATLGTYKGVLEFLVNSTLLESLPMEITVGERRIKILAYTGYQSSDQFELNGIGELRVMRADLPTKGIVLNEVREENITAVLLESYDILWILGANYSEETWTFNPHLSDVDMQYDFLERTMVPTSQPVEVDPAEITVIREFQANGGGIIPKTIRGIQLNYTCYSDT